MLCGFLTFVIVLYIFFDVNYFVRALVNLIYIRLTLKTDRKPNVLEEFVVKTSCSTRDLDTFGHMNNARYLRACEVGRYDLLMRNRIYDTVRKLKGGITLGAMTIRYRREILRGEQFRIHSKVLCWDNKAFYIEQRFVKEKDNFIASIAFFKQAIRKITPQEVVNSIMGTEVESPATPPEIQSFIDCHQLSSDALKKEL